MMSVGSMIFADVSAASAALFQDRSSNQIILSYNPVDFLQLCAHMLIVCVRYTRPHYQGSFQQQ